MINHKQINPKLQYPNFKQYCFLSIVISAFDLRFGPLCSRRIDKSGGNMARICQSEPSHVARWLRFVI
ncbi:hypothetical protein QUF80_17060 [Desulfococcaceae bacterium HSG8]|nr:hypothetical protein [Desulfococcaceae bacterium HSG8]